MWTVQDFEHGAGGFAGALHLLSEPHVAALSVQDFKFVAVQKPAGRLQTFWGSQVVLATPPHLDKLPVVHLSIGRTHLPLTHVDPLTGASPAHVAAAATQLFCSHLAAFTVHELRFVSVHLFVGRTQSLVSEQEVLAMPPHESKLIMVHLSFGRTHLFFTHFDPSTGGARKPPHVGDVLGTHSPLKHFPLDAGQLDASH